MGYLLTVFGILGLLLVLGVPSMAHANTGLPMLVLVLPGGALTLPMVILVEAAFLRQLGLGRARSLKISGAANALSTLVGVPLAWCGLVIVEMLGGSIVWNLVIGEGNRGPYALWQELLIVLWSSAWLVPIREEPTPWTVPAATLVLLVPFFFASYVVELYFVERALGPERPAGVREAVWRANLCTYSLFAAATVAWLAWFVLKEAA